LLARAAKTYRTYFVEEPVRDATAPFMEGACRDAVTLVVPHISPGSEAAEAAQLRTLLTAFVEQEELVAPVLWYYTPMALPWTRQMHRTARTIVYDCMDDLAGFLGAPAEMLRLEGELLSAADLVFTGWASLHEARSADHDAVHCFPSSVDTRHFAAARLPRPEPDDQVAIGRPRIGYFGVLDERVDWSLLAEAAHERPDWHFILIGPVAKVDPSTLPTAPNLHYLGPKPYQTLPAYLGGWDVAMMPFAHNAATRHISPTKTPEYLAGGRPVASTSIRDVVRPYGEMGLVHVGDGARGFLAAVEAALGDDLEDLRRRADAHLEGRSWDRTWEEMHALVEQAARHRSGPSRLSPTPRTMARGESPVAVGAAGIVAS
jgi:DMSO/TMAO reductase YedYZ molybdopterin-dependent catalytic subunit